VLTWFPTRMLALTVAAVAVCAAPATASTIVASFDAETPFSIVPNGFRTAEAPGIAFSDTVGANLQVLSDPLRTNGSLALAVFDDGDDSALAIELDFVATSIELALGNDSPFDSAPGDVALLTVFLAGVEVGSSALELNRNFEMDQIIGFDGGATGVRFDSATLYYAVDPSLGLTEIVDDVRVTPVPEATATTAFGAGSLIVALVCRHRNSLARERRS